ncbi:MAG: GTP cyclohydrolase I FolE [Bacteroidota bacterium]
MNGTVKKNGLNGNGNANGYSLTDDYGDAHMTTNPETPMREDAFELSDEEKLVKIEANFKEILETLGMDLEDDSIQGTPRRVAKMFVKEIFSGLNPINEPSITLFENKFGYQQMLIEKGIKLHTFCEHHFLPIYGVAHVAYIANGKVIGLSKLNRVVEYFAKRPQVQERLTIQIANHLRNVLQTEDVAVYLEAKHMCVQLRGVEHNDCSTVTTEYSGKFLEEATRNEFLRSIS